MGNEEKSASRTVAGLLLDMNVVNVRSDNPFILTSGWASPVYVDCHKIISYPKERRQLMDLACEHLKQAGVVETTDIIAGGETAGIAYAAWISELLEKPMVYVRKKPKGFGRGARIEGEIRQGARTLLVEDLTTDGGSKIAFAEALREAGAVVTDVFSIFYYGIFPEAEKNMSAAGLRLHALVTWKDVLQEMKRRGKHAAIDIAALENFLDDPKAWSEKNGGVTRPAATAV